MKTVFLLCAFAWVFWRGPAPARNAWPAALPALTGEATSAFTLANGDAFASVLSARAPAAALAEAADAFRAAGWREAEIRFADTRLFLRGAAAAAVLAQPLDAGARLTVLVNRGSRIE